MRLIFNKDEEMEDILTENRQLKVKRKFASKQLEKVKEEKDIITTKYIALLEEKSDGFDKYVYYHDLYKEAYGQLKEQKKDIAELKMEIKMLNETITTLEKEKSGLEIKLRKTMEKKGVKINGKS